MKSTITLSALTLAGVILLMNSSPAQAQDRGARFTFSPNVYLKEQSRVPAFQPPVDHHKVAHGHMPKANFLHGIDPNFLKPTPKPVQHTQMAVRPQLMPQQDLSGRFHNAFGRPETPESLPPAQAPVVAHNTPMTAVPKSFNLPPAQEEKAVTAKKLPSRSHNANLSGKLIRKKAPVAQIARAGSMGVASYNNSKYYTPGAYVPHSGGGSSEAKVYGRVIPRK